jgi:hypothetical protein
MFIITLIIGITSIVFLYGNTQIQTTKEGWCNSCRRGYTSNTDRDKDYILKTTYNKLNDPVKKIKETMDEINKIFFSTNATTTTPVPITPKITVFPTISIDPTKGTTIAFDEIYLYFDRAPTCVTTSKKFKLEGNVGGITNGTLNVETATNFCGLTGLDRGQYKITLV